MNLPEYFYQVIIELIIVSVVWAFAAYFTKNGKNFRSSRNKKARRQL